MPYDPVKRALPGIQPLGDDPWLIFDEAFADQMAERDRLLREKRGAVLVLDPQARSAADELLAMVLAEKYPDAGETVTRPDGVRVTVDRDDPLGTLGRIVQDDFVILQKLGDEHVLTGAVLCFPANWTLAEKFLRPLSIIHDPVSEYDDNITRRVQRLFDGVRPGRPIWRYNALWYSNPDLFQPKSPEKRVEGGYLRSERQCILRLPETQAVVFSIHTFLLQPEDAAAVTFT